MAASHIARLMALCWSLVAGCSLLFDFTVEQCKFDVDCNDTASGEAALMCSQSLCVARPGCRRNSDCPLRPGSEAQICVEEKCQTLLGVPECFARFPSEGAVGDGAIVLGAFSRNRASGPVVMPLFNYELAVSELNGDGGFPPNHRQLVLVVCDNGYRAREADEEERTVKAGFQHLTRTLRVPALVAGLNSAQAVRSVFPREAAEAPFLLVPFASDGVVVADDHGLIWYLLNATDNAAALLALAKRVEAGLQRQEDIASAAVVVWQGAGQTANALWGDLEAPLRAAYPQFELVNASAPIAIDDVVAARPNLLLVLDGGPFVEQLVELEERWRARWPERTPPVYLLSPQNATSAALLSALAANPELDASRFVGVNPRRGDAEVLQRYAERFAEHFSMFEGTIDGWNYYDSVYYLAYAAFAASPKGLDSLTSYDVRSGFQKLLQGDDVEIGPAGKARAVELLSGGAGSMRFVGTLGPAEFQTWTGTRTQDGTGVFCLLREDGAVRYRYDVFTYDGEARELEPRGPACSDLLAPVPDP